MNPQEAIESFKNYCDKYATRFCDGSAVNIAHLGGGWAKERFLFERSEDIDVFQTASVMYPYEASHQFIILREITDFHSSKGTAEVDSEFRKRDWSRHIHRYRLDNCFWMPIKRIHQSIYSQETASIIGEAEWYDCIQTEGNTITFTNQCIHGESPALNTESRTTHDVILVGYNSIDKIKICRALKDAVGLSLGEAKSLSENCPCIIMRGVSANTANAIKTSIENAGGVATIM
jgi:ribosomal protein L7/L12